MSTARVAAARARNTGTRAGFIEDRIEHERTGHAHRLAARQAHRVPEFDGQQAEHLSNAILADRGQPSHDGPPDQHGRRTKGDRLEDVPPLRIPPSSSTTQLPETAAAISPSSSTPGTAPSN